VQKIANLLTWSAWGDTDPGKKRENNEDRIFFDPQRGIFVVADGMGGEAAGEVAAEQAVDFIAKRLKEETGSASRRIREAIAGANNEIHRLAERNPEWRGMACVLTAALIENGTLHIGHVGDSRLYEIRGDAIRKITSDHSPVGQKEDSGALTELEAMRHPRRNEVFRDVGSQLHKPDDADFIEYLQIPFDQDAAYILCSDGLSDMLASKEMQRIVLDNAGSPKDSVHQLIEKANAAGGKDNISVIVIEAEGFAALSRKGDGNGSRSLWQRLAVLCTRWAFLIYGLIAGLLASYIWLRPAESGPGMPNPPSLRLPVLLRVSPNSPEYPTIASALDAADAGDRIEVEDGEYEESIRLKNGVDLFAKAPGKVVLRLSHAVPDADAAVMADGVKGAGIAGFAIKIEPAAGLPFGVRISNSNVNISNVEVTGAMRAGVLIDGESGSVLIANFVHENAGPGILTAGVAKPLLIGNLVYANGRSRTHSGPGLYVTENSVPEVKRNIFSANGAEAIRVPKEELKDRMMDNLFPSSGRSGKPVTVERPRQ
jgi:PPM family protein phosphatase